MDLLECSLCANQYDEGKRRARTLPCVHYFCQDCLDQIIKSATPHCPTCRRHITTQSAEMLPPNFLMDDLINKMKTGSVPMDLDGNDEDFSAGSCSKHKKCQLYFTCKTHNVKICRDCTVIEHPPSQCQIISFEDELEETKNITISDLNTQKLNREKNISDLQNIITNTNSKIQEKKREIAKLQREICENEQVMKNANEAVQDCVENKNKIDKIHKELIFSKTINQINNSCQIAEQIIKVSKLIGMSLEINFKFASLKSFQDLIDQSPDEFESKILHGGVTVHTTAEINGETRFAQLMVKNGNIHLPALAPCSRPPSPEYTVTVSSLLTQYPSTNANIYLTLASEGKDLGTVYIKLLNNDNSKYTRKLCMGTIGPSYRGSIFRGKGACSLWTGNVKEYDPSSCSENPPCKSPLVAAHKGTVSSVYCTGLGIWISDKSKVLALPVGEVIKGMSIIDDTWKYPKGKVSIKDVGIVLK